MNYTSDTWHTVTATEIGLLLKMHSTRLPSYENNFCEKVHPLRKGVTVGLSLSLTLSHSSWKIYTLYRSVHNRERHICGINFPYPNYTVPFCEYTKENVQMLRFRSRKIKATQFWNPHTYKFCTLLVNSRYEYLSCPIRLLYRILVRLSN